MTKLRWLSVLPVLLFILLVPAASAKPARPLSYHNGYAALTWSYSFRGGLTTMDYLFPSLPNNGYWDKEMILYGNDNKTYYVGVEAQKNTGQNQFCGPFASGNYWFYGYAGNITCITMTTNPGVCDFGVAVRQNDTSHVYYNMDCGQFATGACPGWSCSDAVFPSLFGTITLREDVNTTWAGWLVTPSNTPETWTSNRYVNYNDWIWHYHGSPSSSNCPGGDGCPVEFNGPPTQMYWDVYPANSSTGGELWSCERSDGNPVC